MPRERLKKGADRQMETSFKVLETEPAKHEPSATSAPKIRKTDTAPPQNRELVRMSISGNLPLTEKLHDIADDINKKAGRNVISAGELMKEFIKKNQEELLALLNRTDL